MKAIEEDTFSSIGQIGAHRGTRPAEELLVLIAWHSRFENLAFQFQSRRGHPEGVDAWDVVETEVGVCTAETGAVISSDITLFDLNALTNTLGVGAVYWTLNSAVDCNLG